MLSTLVWALWPIFLALSVNAQSASQWCDNITGICFWRYYLASTDISWGYLFPPLPAAGQAPSNEFIGFFIAPSSVGWIGNSLGGSMVQNPLILGWVNGNSPVLSARWANAISSPAVLTGPILTPLGSSGVNATHQRIFYRCQNCTTWVGGTNGINLSSQSMFGYATHGSIKPLTPADSASTVYQHTAAGQMALDVSAAHSSSYSAYLQQLSSAPPVTGGGGPTTTSTTPTPTNSVLCPGAPQPSYAMVAANGWRSTPILGRLTTPRGITLDTRGNLLVVERGKGVTVHTLNSGGCVQSSKTLISDTTLNHGIDINPVGNKLIASSADIAWSWDYDPVSQTATNKRTLVTGMNNAGHNTRTVLISRKNPDLFYASVGSNANIDDASFQANSGRAQIRVFSLSGLPANGAAYTSTSGKVMGYGLRNDVGMVEDRSGILFSVENSMDDAYRLVNGQRTDVHNDNPAEKVYRLGDPSAPANLFGGYPYCFSVWEPSNFRDATFQPGDWFVQAPNNTFNDAWCNANAVKPTVLLPPHTAPLDLKFGVGTDTNLYVGLHGSWDRNPPQGYKVVVVPGSFSTSGQWSPSVNLAGTKTSFTDLLKNTNENQCTSGCFRPVGLVFNTAGDTLYVSSDTSGEVFLMRRGSGGGPVITTTTTTTSVPTIPPITTPTTAPTTTPRPTTTTSTAPGPTQTLYGQCAGNGWNGPKVCAAGSTCKYQNDWYSQCLP